MSNPFIDAWNWWKAKQKEAEARVQERKRMRNLIISRLPAGASAGLVLGTHVKQVIELNRQGFDFNVIFHDEVTQIKHHEGQPGITADEAAEHNAMLSSYSDFSSGKLEEKKAVEPYDEAIKVESKRIEITQGNNLSQN